MKLNTKNLSKEALEILALGKGYRSDDQSEMIIFQSPENILDFEINELEMMIFQILCPITLA